MTYYTVGDTPAAPLLVLPARDGDPVDLSLYAAADASVTFPDGTTATGAATIEDDDPDDPHVAIQLPTLAQAGLATIALELTAGARSDTFLLDPLVVQPLDGWHNLQSARNEWDGAKQLEDVRLFVLLRIAAGECATYAPKALTARPIAAREAQLLHARNRNAAARIDPASGSDGMDGFGAGPFPLDWTVKQLLRPRRRFGAIR